MSYREKLIDIIDQELYDMAFDNQSNKVAINLHAPIDRYLVAERLTDKILSQRNMDRPGRRISDVVKDKLLDLHRWVVKR